MELHTVHKAEVAWVIIRKLIPEEYKTMIAGFLLKVRGLKKYYSTMEKNKTILHMHLQKEKLRKSLQTCRNKKEWNEVLENSATRASQRTSHWAGRGTSSPGRQTTLSPYILWQIIKLGSCSLLTAAAKRCCLCSLPPDSQFLHAGSLSAFSLLTLPWTTSRS